MFFGENEGHKLKGDAEKGLRKVLESFGITENVLPDPTMSLFKAIVSEESDLIKLVKIMDTRELEEVLKKKIQEVKIATERSTIDSRELAQKIISDFNLLDLIKSSEMAGFVELVGTDHKEAFDFIDSRKLDQMILSEFHSIQAVFNEKPKDRNNRCGKAVLDMTLSFILRMGLERKLKEMSDMGKAEIFTALATSQREHAWKYIMLDELNYIALLTRRGNFEEARERLKDVVQSYDLLPNPIVG